MSNIIYAGKNAESNRMWAEMLSDLPAVEEVTVILNEVKDTEEKITVRGRGKTHRAIMHSRYGLMISCSCPGSQNGTLEKSVRKVAEGWEMANCGN